MTKQYAIGVFPLPPEEGGGYMAVVADLPGCMSHGETPTEALESVQQAILEWLDEAAEQGIAIPEPGAAAARMREDRLNLLRQMKGQRQALDKLDGEVKILRANLEAFLADANDPEDRQPPWAVAAVYAMSKKKEHNVQ